MNITVKQSDLETEAAGMELGALQAFNECGKDDGNGNRVFDKAKFDLILHSYRRRSAPPRQFAEPPAQFFGPARKRTPEEIEKLKAICQPCPKNDGINCVAQKCCGGKLPLQTIWGVNFNHCPIGKF